MRMSINIIFAILFIYIQSIQFQLQINYYQRLCFSQFITETTPFQFKAIGQEGNYQLSISFISDKILYKNSQKTSIKKIGSYASVTSQYNFCIDNLASNQNFTIQFLLGLQLSDQNALPQQEHSQSINTWVDNVKKEYQTVKYQQHYIFSTNQFNTQLQKTVSFKAVGFGFLSITVVIIIGFLNFLQIKRVLRNRKII